MATLNFRLPAVRNDAAAQRRVPLHRATPPLAVARGGDQRRAMNAEDAALIALRRLSAAAAEQAGLCGADGESENFACSGWFDSTWELAQGLDICEGPPVDLPLDGWLQLYLASGFAVSAATTAA